MTVTIQTTGKGPKLARAAGMVTLAMGLGIAATAHAVIGALVAAAGLALIAGAALVAWWKYR